MLRNAASIGTALVICGLALGGFACNEDPPTDPYALNLGTPDAPLLPVAPALVSARDPRIMTNPQANLVKRGDTEAAQAARSAPAAGSAELEPASSISEALSSIGRAFLGMKGPAEAPEPDEEAPATGGEITPAAGEVTLADTDAKAIAQLVAALNQARADRKLSALVDLAAPSQKTGAQAVFPLLEELLASVNSALAAVESTQPDLKTSTDAELAAILAPWQASALAAVDATTARSQVTVGDTAVTVRFVRADEQWRVAFPALPQEADATAARDDLQAAIDRLDDLAEAAAGGSAPDATAVQDAVTAALKLLRTYLVAG